MASPEPLDCRSRDILNAAYRWRKDVGVDRGFGTVWGRVYGADGVSPLVICPV